MFGSHTLDCEIPPLPWWERVGVRGKPAAIRGPSAAIHPEYGGQFFKLSHYQRPAFCDHVVNYLRESGDKDRLCVQLTLCLG